MKITLTKSLIQGKVEAPPSKSYTIRALMCAALSPGLSYIRYPLDADDTRAATEVLSRIGAIIRPQSLSWRVGGGQLKAPSADLFCRDSAATFRFMMALAALLPGTTRLVPGESLAKRPVKPLLEALLQLGVKCSLEGSTVIVEGGKVSAGDVSLQGNSSSQFVSALLLIAPLTEHGLNIQLTTPPRSRSYLGMTVACLHDFGIRVKSTPDFRRFSVARQEYRPASYNVEGDWSQAAFLLALGALAGEVLVTNLNAESLQGDRKILNLLQKMGASFSLRRNSVLISKSRLHAVSADLSDCIDLLPIMAALAATAEGQSEFSGIAAGRLKESDRVLAVKTELLKMGIHVTEEEDKISIFGGTPTGAIIDSHGDHRMAMAFGALGIVTGESTILGAECVAKTYPDYWKVLQGLGGKAVSDV
jgi:3-phosphoshikimate 1-carboxyvinyltransferase